MSAENQCSKEENMNRQKVFDAINSERDFQDRKWGTPAEHPHEVGAWLLLMQVHLTKAQQALASANNDMGAMEEEES